MSKINDLKKQIDSINSALNSAIKNKIYEDAVKLTQVKYQLIEEYNVIKETESDIESRVYKAPVRGWENESVKIFLAGSIEMGKAEDWQTIVTKELKNANVCILNPRRDDWDSSWEQKISNPQFNEQVTWELDALDAANIIIIYFDPNTQSPITLLELGLHAPREDQFKIVCCAEGFWRKGNVDIVCNRYNIPVVENINDAIDTIKDKIKELYEI